MSEADKTAYLKEAMRMVELGMEEQHISNTVLERKAALLITFCTAVIGYLAPAEFYLSQIYGTHVTVGKIISILFLVGAAAFSMEILRLSPFITRGSNPEAVLDPYYGHSCDKFAEYYLNFSKEGFQKNIDITKKKVKRLKAAYYLSMVGLTVSFALILTDQIARLLSH